MSEELNNSGEAGQSSSPEFSESPEGAEERTEALEDYRGLPDSASNDNPLPLAAVDATVNKAEGDHEALAENAYQAKAVEESEDTSFNGLTSVDEQMRDDNRRDIEEAQAEAPAPADELDATDSARELAAERGIDLADVKGSGKDGRITRSDVESHSA